MTYYGLKASVAVQVDPIPILYSNGSIWVGNHDSASVSRINPVTNAVTATITSAGVFTKPTSLAEDQFGNVWVACSDFTSGSVSRIDPATNTITASLATADGFLNTGIGMGAGELWVSSQPSSYTRYDTTTLLSTSAVATTAFGYNFVDDGTNVWFDDGTGCNKIAPSTNTITRITTGIVAGLGFLHYAFGYVWRVTGSGIQRVDPSTNALTTITIAANAVQGITDDGTDLIVSDIGGELYVVDPSSFTVKQTLTSTSYYWGTTFGDGSIWVNAHFSDLCKKFSNVGGIFTDGAAHL